MSSKLDGLAPLMVPLLVKPLIAGFGGFLGRKRDGHPGPEALWISLQRVREFAIGITVAKEVFIPTG